MANSGAATSAGSEMMKVICSYGDVFGAYRPGETETRGSLPWEPEEKLTLSGTVLRNHPYFQIIIDALRTYSKSESVIHNLKIDNLVEEIRKHWQKEAAVIKINMLETKGLRQPLDALIEPDGDGFIARTVDFPLFGYGDDRIEAIDALKSEIESLYIDLMEDDNFTEEWRGIKAFLKDQVIDA